LEDVNEAEGTFKIRFSINNSLNSRSAVVRVTSGCTALYKDFLFTQLGKACPPNLVEVTEIFAVPTVATIASKNPREIELYAGGAVYLYLDPAPSNPEELIWTRNDQELPDGLGVHHITVTQTGTYNVWRNTIGCYGLDGNAVKVTRNNTPAPPPVDLVVAGNNGRICSIGGTVDLIALASSLPSGALIYWFKDGKLEYPNKIGERIQAGVGKWFAAVYHNGAWSMPSNTVTVFVDPTAGIPLPDVEIVFAGGVTVGGYCAGGVVSLTVKDYDPTLTYTWYENNTPVATGEFFQYSVPTTVPKVVIRCQATYAGHCPAEDMDLVNITTGTIPGAPYITGDRILCNGSTTLNIVTQLSGTYAYFWYKDNVYIGPGQQRTFYTGGEYAARVLDTTSGCASPMVPFSIPNGTLSAPTVTLSPSSTTATENDIVTYTAAITSGPVKSYTWSVSNNAMLISGGQPGDNYATVRFHQASVTARVSVQVENDCGAGSTYLDVNVSSGCADAIPGSAQPSSAQAVSIPSGSSHTLGPVSVSFVGGSLAETAYQWYSRASAGASGTQIAGATGSTYVANAAGYYYCVMKNKNCGTVTATTADYVVTIMSIPTGEGKGTFSGKACFDIAYSNSGGNCGDPTVRAAKKLDFGNTTEQDPSLGAISGQYSRVQVYKFIPPSAVSNVEFAYDDPGGMAIESITPKANYSGTYINDAKVQVVFKQALHASVQGRTINNAYKVKLYAIYSDNPSGGGTRRRLEMTLSFQDCACCEVATTYGGWMNFMCYNLGANESLSPFEYSTGILGHFYQWGRKADGHQYRTSPTTTALASSSTPGHNLFITNTTAPYDWLASNAGANRWGDGAFEPEFAPKGPNDPCPQGWQVPTTWQWSSIFRGNYHDAGATPGQATANTWLWTGNGFLIGSSLYLPAAGTRQYNNGSIIEEGSYGGYWSSSLSPPLSRYMDLHINSVMPLQTHHRAQGMSVRCVSQ
jgi:uncharacterized protein (TIGR02145 family)